MLHHHQEDRAPKEYEHLSRRFEGLKRSEGESKKASAGKGKGKDTDSSQVEEMSKLYESMKTMYEEMSKKLAAKEMQEQLENLKKQLKMDEALEQAQQEEEWRKKTVQAEPKPKQSSRSIVKKGKKHVEEDSDKPEFDQFADGDGDSADGPTTGKDKDKTEHKKEEQEKESVPVPTPVPAPEPTKSRKWSDQWKVGALCWRVLCWVQDKPFLAVHIRVLSQLSCVAAQRPAVCVCRIQTACYCTGR